MFRKAVLAITILVAVAPFMADMKEATHPTPATAAHATTRFADLRVAVDAGIVDSDAVSALQRDGSVDALISFDSKSLERKVDVNGPGDLDRSENLALRKEIYRHGEDLIAGIAGIDVLRTYRNLPSVYARFASAESMLAVANRSTVTSIRANHVQEPTLTQSLKLIRRGVGSAQGRNGAGVDVVVLDTGLKLANVGCTANFQPSTCRFASYDITDSVPHNVAHGTNTSAIAGAVAPAAHVRTIDVFRLGANGKLGVSEIDAHNALEQVLTWKNVNGINIRAVNMSFGSWSPQACQANSSTYYGTDFARLRSAKILPVIASGNDNHTDGVGYPACLPGAVSVGAVYDASFNSLTWGETGHTCTDRNPHADLVTCFSNDGAGLDLLAPGSQITAGGVTQSGTSQAAPHVAGAVAVLAAAKPSATAAEIERALTSSGPVITDPRSGRQHHRLDLPSAVTALMGAGDSVAPTSSAPVQYLQQGTTVTATGDSTVRIRWSATDNVGVTSFWLQASTNGAAWTDQTISSATATYRDFVLAQNSSYQFRVAARDAAGNWSAWATGAAFRLRSVSEDDAQVGYSDNWTLLGWSPALGGQLAGASDRLEYVSFRFTGTDVEWISALASNAGTANVWIDGQNVAAANLVASTAQARYVAFQTGWNNEAEHLIQIQVSSQTGTVFVDGFIYVELI